MVSDINTTGVIRSLLANPRGSMPPLLRKVILECFLAARKATAERVSETEVHPRINVTTYMSYDANATLLCEDVFVESRVPIR